MVPDTDETVATGAAVQAVMAMGEATAGELAEAWDLGEGSLVEPVADGAGVREAYQAVIA